MLFKRYKSASNQHQHSKSQLSTMGRPILPSTSEEGNQSDSNTIPYQSDSDIQTRGRGTPAKRRAMNNTSTSKKLVKTSSV